MDSELESFKSNIDLRAYAAGQGYQLDRKESWRGSRVMRPQRALRSSKAFYEASLHNLADASLTGVILVSRPEPSTLTEAERAGAELEAIANPESNARCEWDFQGQRSNRPRSRCRSKRLVSRPCFRVRPS
jgi:hypothetical protein